jgi:hypothetical protein
MKKEVILLDWAMTHDPSIPNVDASFVQKWPRLFSRLPVIEMYRSQESEENVKGFQNSLPSVPDMTDV